MARPSSAHQTAKLSPARLSNPSTPSPHPKDFILTEKLGSGTYATVYKAYRKVECQVIGFRDIVNVNIGDASRENESVSFLFRILTCKKYIQ